MNFVITKIENSDVSYEQLVDLMHESFQERLEQGLNFTSCTMDYETFVRRYSDGIVIVGLDLDTNMLMAFYTVHIREDEKQVKYGYLEQLAVSPKAKRMGIGTKMLNAILDIVQECGGKYVLSDTACGATSSVNWHLKNGFIIYELESYRSTNYWSYVFIRYLDSSIRKNKLQNKVHYCLSWVFMKTTRYKSGSDTVLGKFYKNIRSKCKN